MSAVRTVTEADLVRFEQLIGCLDQMSAAQWVGHCKDEPALRDWYEGRALLVDGAERQREAFNG